MVVGAFPIAKLGALLIRQISKPIANAAKERAKNHPFFRTYVCMPPAQFYNWCEVKAKMWILNLGKPVNIPVLSQEMAIDLGANLLGETLIFTVAATILLLEYNRQNKKEAAKELKRENEMNHITTTITDLYFTVQQQQTQLKEMERIIHSISGRKPTVPPPVLKEPSLPKSHTSGETDTPVLPKPSTPSQDPCKIDDVKYERHDNVIGISTPYPNNGIILQSLNYIQLDAFSSLFLHNDNTNISKKSEVIKEKSSHKRESAILTSALVNIENNFRSLF